MTRSIVRNILAVGALAGLTTFLGCGEDKPVDIKSTAPPVTAESVKDLSTQISSQKGFMGPGGVTAPPVRKQP